MFGLGAPVIIGPMNGGMDFPPAFRRMQGRGVGLAMAAGRGFAHFLNLLMPGKRRAAILLVANDRSRRALPRGASARVEELVENGVDLSMWRPAPTRDRRDPGATRYVFVGRLIALKGVDSLLRAFADAATKVPISLTIVGGGPERFALERRAAALGVLDDGAGATGKAVFTGWLPQTGCAERLRAADAMVLPSLMECGGAVVLEAMAMGLPVIATAWGGPADYLDPSCGILVDVTSRTAFERGLSAAMVRLAQSPHERESMGEAGRQKVARQFDWEVKIDRMLQIYERVARSTPAPAFRACASN